MAGPVFLKALVANCFRGVFPSAGPVFFRAVFLVRAILLDVVGVKRDGLILANLNTFRMSLPLEGGWDRLTATKALEPFLEASSNDLFRVGTAGTLNISPIISVMDGHCIKTGITPFIKL